MTILDSVIASAVSLTAVEKVSALDPLGEQPAGCLSNCSDGLTVRALKTLPGEWRQCKGSWRSRGWLSSPFSSLSFPFFLPSGSRKLQKSQSLGKLLGDSQGTAEPAETVWGL